MCMQNPCLNQEFNAIIPHLVFCSTLMDKYNITTIPKLIIIRSEGEVITTKGRKDIQDKGLISFRAWHAAMLAAVKKEHQQQELMNQEDKSDVAEEDQNNPT